MLSGRLRGAKRKLLLVSLAAVVLAVAGILHFQAQPRVWYGYVVGRDLDRDVRIYMVNLETGELEWVSRVLEELKPDNPYLPHNYIAEIEINREDSILYIGQSSDLFDYLGYPTLLAVRLNESADTVFEITDAGVERVRMNHAKDQLYVYFYSGPEFFTVLDPRTGENVGRLNGLFQKSTEISPDGEMIVRIVPRFEMPDGEAYPGYLSYAYLENLEERKRTDLEDNQSLYPPWQPDEDYFVYPKRWGDINRLEVYDRENGELIAFNEDDFSHSITHILGAGRFAVPGGDGVIVFDGSTAEVLKRIRVADDVFLEDDGRVLSRARTSEQLDNYTRDTTIYPLDVDTGEGKFKYQVYEQGEWQWRSKNRTQGHAYDCDP